MWGFGAGKVPAREHESCARRFAELEERIAAVELTSVERNLQVLELAEKVSHRLTERKRKRSDNGEPEELPYHLILRRRHGLHER